MLIECEAFLGGTKLIPRERVTFRPSVYAVIVRDGRVLLLNNRRTNKYFLPGGGVDIEENLGAALQRETREEAGIEIHVGEFLFFREQFFYYDPLDLAFHNFAFFYRCEPRTFDLLADDQVQDEESEKPRWIEIQTLRAGDFQTFGADILAVL